MQKTNLNTVLLYLSYSACNSSCIGLMACTDLTGVNCCNYFGLDGACLLECPANSTTNSDFHVPVIQGIYPIALYVSKFMNVPLIHVKMEQIVVNLLNDYTCNCVAGYTDNNCSTNINNCLPEPCQNGGNCTDLISDYSCTCEPGLHRQELFH